MKLVITVVVCLAMLYLQSVSSEEKMINLDSAEKASGTAFRGIIRNDLAAVEAAFKAFPSLKNDKAVMRPWLLEAVSYNRPEIIEHLLLCGCDINDTDERRSISVLTKAIDTNHYELLPLLLKHGADPNVGDTRALLSAINANQRKLETVKLLVEHGADVNLVFDLYGDPDSLFTAVQFADPYPEIVAYLKSKGAKTVAQLRAEGKLVAPENEPEMDEPPSRPGHVIEWFEKNIGPLGKESLTEIIPTSGVPLTIHVVPATTKRPYITLFTAGMSEEPLDVTAENKEYEYAELFIQLPKDWKYKDLKNPRWNWPIVWLRKIADMAQESEGGLGGGVTIIADDDPPSPIAPGLPFTSMLLMAEHELSSIENSNVHLYRLTPLHTDERDLEFRQGLPALMNAFDKKSMPFIVDINRKSVVRKE